MSINQRGSAMIAVVVIAIVINITLLAFFFATRHTSKASGDRRENVTALNIAEAGKERLYAAIRSDAHRPALNSPPVTMYDNETFSGGSYTVSYRADPWADTLWIRSSAATAKGKPAIVEVIALLPPLIPIDAAPVRGAVTARARVEVSGSITIDGNEHDTSCNLTGDPGTYAVSTTDSCTVDGSAEIGGNGQAPVDWKLYDLKKNPDPTIRQTVAEENAPDGNFDSPEAFLGLPAGALDAFKFSASNLDQDFHGVRYDTCASVGPVDFGSSSGLLIVHNGSKSAQLKVNGGTFKGLIICDDIIKMNGNLVVQGAIVVLKEADISFKGLGSTTICYSSYILTHLSRFCGDEVRNRVNEVSWKEVK
ncbi:MAG: hypothetical protein JXA18_11140 [Chitinispirillaceae bacterium]|nr:hypothetical protein [Chitinispirillaceae bacterium]